MNTLAFACPGPWIPFLSFVGVALIVTVVTALRRFGGRHPRGLGGWGGFGGPGAARVDERSPIAVLGRRFAAGEIDEDEYGRRLAVLEEQFGRLTGGGERRV
ncbi:SHOCT domain-containing protein [Streptomyces sp. NPDC048718]|uniref:SHOCT domain-containing protein n=1 Tax=Streptomyces sp. NPDC048718 TaxID=3365587 RepID=UPI00372250EE